MPDNIELEFLFEVFAELRAPRRVPSSLGYDLLVYDVTGGTFEGPHGTGKLLDHGGDWFRLYPDGVGRLDVQIVLETSDGAIIHASYKGVMDNAGEVFQSVIERKPIAADSYYFFVTPVFDTTAPQYSWLSKIVCLGKGEVTPGGVKYRFFAVR
jgi:hypothetical protein